MSGPGLPVTCRAVGLDRHRNSVITDIGYVVHAENGLSFETDHKICRQITKDFEEQRWGLQYVVNHCRDTEVAVHLEGPGR
jgi:hypothetical protein